MQEVICGTEVRWKSLGAIAMGADSSGVRVCGVAAATTSGGTTYDIETVQTDNRPGTKRGPKDDKIYKVPTKIYKVSTNLVPN